MNRRKLLKTMVLGAAGLYVPRTFSQGLFPFIGGVKKKTPAGGGGGSNLLNSIVSYWMMNEATGATREDSVGTNDLNNLINAPDGVAALISNGVEINATNESCRIDSPSGLVVASGGVFTIAGWVRPLISIGTLECFGSYSSYPSNVQWAFQTTTTGGNQFNLYFRAGGADFNLGSGGGTVTTSTWYHVVIEIDDVNKTLKYWMNNGGVPASTTYTGTPAAVTPAFQFGRVATSSNAQRALYDEFGVWSRALTSDERSELYNGGAGKTYPFT